MFDDKAGMPRGAVSMPSSFSEDKKKLDADFMVCVILLPFLFILSDNKVGEELKIPTQPNPTQALYPNQLELASEELRIILLTKSK